MYRVGLSTIWRIFNETDNIIRRTTDAIVGERKFESDKIIYNTVNQQYVHILLEY